MARNYNIHLLTLAQVPNLLRVEGQWPGSIALRAGWFRARARPWNDAVTDPMVRLDRGGTEFLIAATDKLFDLGAGSVYSPALYGTATGIWRRSGFEEYARLEIMERLFNHREQATDTGGVREMAEPDWEAILDVDRSAFEGFWGMSRLGLREAYRTSRASAMLVTGDGERLSGYAVVGSQWGAVYLHRIAVRPEDSGQGLGSALLSAAVEWGSRNAGRSMVLNVRPENTRAKRLYEHHGFANTGTALEVLRKPPR